MNVLKRLLASSCILLLFCIVFVNNQQASAATQALLEKPMPSPENKLAVNVEWDSVGYVGRIAMAIYRDKNEPEFRVELPQINPSPANLSWINEDWVVCESIISARGSAFFYVNVQTKTGYIIEIFEPEKSSDWIISIRSRDTGKSFEVQLVSEKQTSLFPILLRQLPTDGVYYFTPEFVTLLQDAVDSYLDWKRQSRIDNLTPLSAIANYPNRGSLITVRKNDKPYIAYFPSGTTTTREMLAATKFMNIPDEFTTSVLRSDYDNLKLNWVGTAGTYELKVLASATTTSESVATISIKGYIPNAQDFPYKGPTIEELVKVDQQELGTGEPAKSNKELKLSVNPSPKKIIQKSKKIAGKKSSTSKSSKKTARSK